MFGIINKTMGKHTTCNARSVTVGLQWKRLTWFMRKAQVYSLVTRNARIIIERVNICSSKCMFKPQFRSQAFLLPLALSSTSCNPSPLFPLVSQHSTLRCRVQTTLLARKKCAEDPEVFRSEQCSAVWSSLKQPRLRNGV